LSLFETAEMGSHYEPSNYPFLTKEEFGLACHLLDQKYIAAALGDERRNFRLRLQYSMISDSVSVSITKPIDISNKDISDILDLEGLKVTTEDGVMKDGEPAGALMDVDAEEADSVSMDALLVTTTARVWPEPCGLS
jgi:hypothetical protein